MQIGLVPKPQWAGIEMLGFKILIPAIIVNSIYESDLSLSRLGAFVGLTISAVSIAAVLIFFIRSVVGKENLPNPQFTTLFQTTTRWNAFIGLAAGAQLLGDMALVLISVAMAFLIPVINVVNIIVLSVFGEKKLEPMAITLSIAKNPLVLACALGLALNYTGIKLPEQAAIALDMISRGALAVGLLAIGAGIDFSRLLSPSLTMIAGVFMRIVVCPAIFLLLGNLIGLVNAQMVCGAIVCAVPAASNGYIVARQMGGDAELYACILTWQTVFAAISIPAFIELANRLSS
jgi:predicted permease